jgi:catechol 2,3-dioxygenase-like lactoylglutathione lyase family enzyme
MSSIAVAPRETEGRPLAGLSQIGAAFSDTADVAGRNAYFRDPDGHLMEIIGRTSQEQP